MEPIEGCLLPYTPVFPICRSNEKEKKWVKGRWKAAAQDEQQEYTVPGKVKEKTPPRDSDTPATALRFLLSSRSHVLWLPLLFLFSDDVTMVLWIV